MYTTAKAQRERSCNDIAVDLGSPGMSSRREPQTKTGKRKAHPSPSWHGPRSNRGRAGIFRGGNGNLHLDTFPQRLNHHAVLATVSPRESPRIDPLPLPHHRAATMDAPEPDTPFSAVTAQTTKYGRVREPPSRWKWSLQPIAVAHCQTRSAAMRRLCETHAEIKLLTRGRYSKPTSINPHPSPYTDGSGPVFCSCFSPCEYSLQRGGTSVGASTSDPPCT